LLALEPHFARSSDYLGVPKKVNRAGARGTGKVGEV